MVKPGILSELGGTYVSVLVDLGALATNATSRMPTNTPPLAQLVAAERFTWGSDSTIVASTLTPVTYAASLGTAGTIALKDYRTVTFRPTSTAKMQLNIIARIASKSFSGKQATALI
jgi:hypothetical protein